jgi:anaerobic selenocysteine-containing dehydrogenase
MPAKNTRTLYRSCPTCEACCGLEVEVDLDKRAVISIKGDPDHVRSKGYVCAKSQAFRYIYEDPERLRQPVKKIDGQWVEISWEDALSETASRLANVRDQHGKDAIAMYYGNPNGHNFATQMYTQMLIAMLDTERFFSAGSVDQQPQNLICDLMYGNAWALPIPDLPRSDFFVCMGGNPLVSQGSLMGAANVKVDLQGISERGKTVVIDPRRTETAEFADQHLFIRPGTDALLLFAWVNELFSRDMVNPGHLSEFLEGVEELWLLAAPFTPESVAEATGVSAEDLRRLVTEFNAADAPVLYSRIGLCTQEFGTLASWLVHVINILQGRLDAPGGLMFSRPATGQNEHTGKVNEVPYGRFKSRVRGFPEYMGMLPASCMAEEMTCGGEEGVRALITVAGNPVLSVPDGKRIGEAMTGLDFVVALDFYINETTVNADIILPSTSQLEHSNYDFLFSGFTQRNYSQYSPEVFSPEPGAMHQYEIVVEILARMNGMAAADLADMMLEGMLGEILQSPGLAHLSAEEVKNKTSQHTGPDRLLDILLRIGPYGDKFDEGSEGVNLTRLQQAEHGLDFGQMESQLPGLLRTEGQRLVLIYDLIVNDIPRLQQRLNRPPADMLMIGRRHIRDMNSWLHNINNYVRGKNRCTLLVNPADASRLGLVDGGQAMVKGNDNQQQVEVELSEQMMPGVVSLPHGFGHNNNSTGQTTAKKVLPGVSANDLVGTASLDMPSGTSVVNGVPVDISPA